MNKLTWISNIIDIEGVDPRFEYEIFFCPALYKNCDLFANMYNIPHYFSPQLLLLGDWSSRRLFKTIVTNIDEEKTVCSQREKSL